jgi:endonuclease YncB( thermonuclease family)
MGVCNSKNKINNRDFKNKLVDETEKELELITLDSVPKFNFNNEFHLCKVLSCYDGDTVRVAFKYNNQYYNFSIRLYGIDCPEIRSKNKERAIMIRDYVREQLLNKNVYIECGRFDKYGRVLGKIYETYGNYLKDDSFNEKLIKLGYAKKYEI